jgi:sulfite exporter TauE/SafE
MEGFLLGLASGTTCLAFCAPVLIPFLLSEGNNIPRNLVTLLTFLGGRLGGYLIFGLLAWAMGGLLVGAGSYQAVVIGTAYVGLSVLLLVAVLRKKAAGSGACALEGVAMTLGNTTLSPVTPGEAKQSPVAQAGIASLTLATTREDTTKGAQARLNRWPALLPVGMGLVAGLKICPPLLLAFTTAAGTGSLGGSLFLFLMFFLGTSVYFLPVSLLGAFTRLPDLRMVGKFAAVIVAVYYLFSGVLLFTGGVGL